MKPQLIIMQDSSDNNRCVTSSYVKSSDVQASQVGFCGSSLCSQLGNMVKRAIIASIICKYVHGYTLWYMKVLSFRGC